MAKVKSCTVTQSCVGLLYENGVFMRILRPGKYKFKNSLFKKRVDRSVIHIDMRERSLTIKGQEILTADKIAIRVSLLVYFKVIDPTAAAHNVASYEDRIYEDVQLAARRFLASRSLEATLSDRNDISEAVKKDVKEAASMYGVEIIRADVKDLIFPGNLREIMNQVLETERKSEAKIIQAMKEAETLKIQLESQQQAEKIKFETEKIRLELKLEEERKTFNSKLENIICEAQAAEENPEVLKLRQLDVLIQMAKNGGKFIVGLNDDTLKNILRETIQV